MQGELRCSACIRAGRYSKILLKFSLGAVTPDGEITVRCKCGHSERLTAANHYGDGEAAFRCLPSTQESMRRVHVAS
jgi:hypothetical protein